MTGAVPANRKAVSREGTVGGPCHTIKGDGYWCARKAVTVCDRYGYCKRHAPKTTTTTKGATA